LIQYDHCELSNSDTQHDLPIMRCPSEGLYSDRRMQKPGTVGITHTGDAGWKKPYKGLPQLATP
ncbi:MAG: hypothetical protein QOF90_737, partial [Acetobacteraceae bacterium]|nr:hypothetical protein [Acetobacteraceae bacterium]